MKAISLIFFVLTITSVFWPSESDRHSKLRRMSSGDDTDADSMSEERSRGHGKRSRGHGYSFHGGMGGSMTGRISHQNDMGASSSSGGAGGISASGMESSGGRTSMTGRISRQNGMGASSSSGGSGGISASEMRSSTGGTSMTGGISHQNGMRIGSSSSGAGGIMGTSSSSGGAGGISASRMGSYGGRTSMTGGISHQNGMGTGSSSGGAGGISASEMRSSGGGTSMISRNSQQSGMGGSEDVWDLGERYLNTGLSMGRDLNSGARTAFKSRFIRDTRNRFRIRYVVWDDEIKRFVPIGYGEYSGSSDGWKTGGSTEPGSNLKKDGTVQTAQANSIADTVE